MTKIFNLPRDLEEEVLCRIPLTSLRTVRSTCKKWNTLSKYESFAKKYLGDQAKVAEREREFMVVMMMNFRVYLMRVNLQNNVESSCIKREAELISLGDEVDISQVFHCEGLLLCISITKDKTRLVVWNPYWGHTRTIELTHNLQIIDRYMYALGYNKSSKSQARPTGQAILLRGIKICWTGTGKSHKILRFITYWDPNFEEFKIYDFNSDSWRVLDVTPDWTISHIYHGVSLKGNAYWFANKKYSETRRIDHFFLVCFDFTRETFGPLLPLPFEFAVSKDAMSVSSFREEQLAVLYQPWDTLWIEIWITSKIEPNTLSWNSKVFLLVSLKQLFGPQFHFYLGSFFIDEEKKVVVVFDKDYNDRRNIAYIIGVDGSFKAVDLGESAYAYPLVCSYVPSIVQLN
ncbi:unnamed protein product [Arabidopsis halleri]